MKSALKQIELAWRAAVMRLLLIPDTGISHVIRGAPAHAG